MKRPLVGRDVKAAKIGVTKRGKPLGKVVPDLVVERSLFEFAAGKVIFRGGIFETGEAWEAERTNR